MWQSTVHSLTSYWNEIDLISLTILPFVVAFWKKKISIVDGPVKPMIPEMAHIPLWEELVDLGYMGYSLRGTCRLGLHGK